MAIQLFIWYVDVFKEPGSDSCAHNQAARQGHEAVVDILVQAGATFAGADLYFVPYGMKEPDTIKPNDDIWLKAGWKPS